MRQIAVKLVVTIVLLSGVVSHGQEGRPDPRELLRSARVAQANMDWKFTGHLRVGSSSKKIPFILTISNGVIRYDFQDNRDAITLRLGDRSSVLEETVGGKTQRIGTGRFGQAVRDTGISYEDLTLQFLYWPNPKLNDADIIAGRDSWEVEIRPPGQGASQYASVKVWLAKADNALMMMEAYDAEGKMVRKFVVRNFMKRDDYWFLKKMDIVNAASGKTTALELNDLVR